MNTVVDACITHIGEWMPSKFDDYSVMVVGFKDISSGKTYKLNLSKRYPETVNRWIPNIELGNVLKCSLKSSPKNNIDHFAPYRIVDIKKKNVDSQESAKQITLALQLENIEKIIGAIREDFNIN